MSPVNEMTRRDVEAYLAQPLGTDEQAIADLPVEVDLGDDDLDYTTLSTAQTNNGGAAPIMLMGCTGGNGLTYKATVGESKSRTMMSRS